MIKMTITLYVQEKSENKSQELASELLSKLHDGGISYGLHITNGEDGINFELDTSKHSKKAPQSVLKAVSDSLDRVYSEGFKQAKNEKFSRVSYVPYDFPEYSHEGSTIICKAADLKDPTSKGYGRFIEEYNKYMSAMGHTKPQKYKGDI